MRHVRGEELDAGLLQAEQEVGAACQAIELGDQQHGAAEPALGERQTELRPVAAPAALDLLEGCSDQAAAAGGMAGDGRSLGVEAEAGVALLVGGDAVVGDEARAGRDGHGRDSAFTAPVSQSERTVC